MMRLDRKLKVQLPLALGLSLISGYLTILPGNTADQNDKGLNPLAPDTTALNAPSSNSAATGTNNLAIRDIYLNENKQLVVEFDNPTHTTPVSPFVRDYPGQQHDIVLEFPKTSFAVDKAPKAKALLDELMKVYPSLNSIAYATANDGTKARIRIGVSPDIIAHPALATIGEGQAIINLDLPIGEKNGDAIKAASGGTQVGDNGAALGTDKIEKTASSETGVTTKTVKSIKGAWHSSLKVGHNQVNKLGHIAKLSDKVNPIGKFGHNKNVDKLSIPANTDITSSATKENAPSLISSLPGKAAITELSNGIEPAPTSSVNALFTDSSALATTTAETTRPTTAATTSSISSTTESNTSATSTSPATATTVTTIGTAAETTPVATTSPVTAATTTSFSPTTESTTSATSTSLVTATTVTSIGTAAETTPVATTSPVTAATTTSISPATESTTSAASTSPVTTTTVTSVNSASPTAIQTISKVNPEAETTPIATTPIAQVATDIDVPPVSELKPEMMKPAEKISPRLPRISTTFPDSGPAALSDEPIITPLSVEQVLKEKASLQAIQPKITSSNPENGVGQQYTGKEVEGDNSIVSDFKTSFSETKKSLTPEAKTKEVDTAVDELVKKDETVNLASATPNSLDNLTNAALNNKSETGATEATAASALPAKDAVPLKAQKASAGGKDYLPPKFSDEAVEHYNKAVRAHLSGKLTEAVTEYTAAIEADSQIAEAYSNLGLIFNQQRKYDQAMTEFHKALVINPKDAITYNGIGAAMRAKNNMVAAKKNWKAAIAIDPKLASAHYNLGTAYELEKDMEQALVEYKEAVKYDDKLGEAYYRMGLVLQKMNNKNLALQEYKHAVKISQQATYASDAKRRINLLSQSKSPTM